MGEEEWLELCLLLGDGRFQPLEAPLLALHMPDDFAFKAWESRFSELCSANGQSLQPPDAKHGDSLVFQANEERLDKCMDEIIDSHVAPVAGSGKTQKPLPVMTDQVVC